MTLVLTVETSFGGNEMQLARVGDYLTAISPCIEKQPAALAFHGKPDDHNGAASTRALSCVPRPQ